MEARGDDLRWRDAALLHRRRVDRLGTRCAHHDDRIPLLFGRWTPAGEYWNGLIDRGRIYGRVLSQSEVQSDMGGTVTPNVAPTISLTTPVGGATFTAPATIALAATAADSDGSVAKVDFYNGTTLLGTERPALTRIRGPP